LPLSS